MRPTDKQYTIDGIGRYFDEINILRAFAILAVISIHISAYFTRMPAMNSLAIAYMTIDVISSFAVPLFVCISGFVLYNRYPGKIDLKAFYKKRMLSVLPQYIIFSTFYLGLSYLIAKVLATPLDFDIPHILFWYLSGECFYHLWFIVLIIEFYILYPVIVRIYHYCDSRGKSPELLIGVLILSVCYNVYTLPDVFIAGTGFPVWGVATKFIGYLFYFMLGIIVRSKYEDLLRKPVSDMALCCLSVPLFFCTLVGIFIAAQYHFSFDITRILAVTGLYWRWIAALIIPILCLVTFAFSVNIYLHIVSHKSTAFKLLEKIGHYSLGIYLVHAFILTMLVLLFARFGFTWNNWLFYPVTFCFTVTLSIFSVDLIGKLPYSKYIIGNTSGNKDTV